MLGVVVGLLRLFERRLLLDFLRAGDQVIDLGHDKSLRNDRSPSRFKVKARAAKRSLIQIKHEHHPHSVGCDCGALGLLTGG
jgi:hypothetical protein